MSVHAKGLKIVHTGEGVKKWQNSVHVVVECPQKIVVSRFYSTHSSLLGGVYYKNKFF